MAELDDKLIQNLNQRLQTMETLLSNLTKTLGGVKEGMVEAFNPSIVKSWSDSIKGLRTIRLIDAEKSKSDIKEINDMVRVLTQERKHGRTFTLFTEEEYNSAIQRLAKLRIEIEKLNAKAKSKEGLTEDEALVRETLRQQRDALYMATRRGGYLGAPLSPEQLAKVNDELARYKALQSDINKGSERRAAELANLQATEQQNQKNELLKQENQLNKEIAQEERERYAEEKKRLDEAKAANKTQTQAEDEAAKLRREQRTAQSKAAYKQQAQEEAAATMRMNKAVQQQIQYYRQLHTLYKEYKALQAKPNKTAEDNAVLEQTKQKIIEILRLSKQLELENKGSAAIAKQATEFERVRDRAREARGETEKMGGSLNKLLPTLQRLASAFGVAFSVRGLAQFGKKLIETRGEFELQQVALRSILQNKQLADEIWDKTMQAALQSPFTAMQLTKYTKQLAAYRIETDKLFDTTKRLADVSAGLGVDMQRLILAYGQVKAANYLRASEIRQFTEAGVNILGELSQYFTETREGMYDTAKVMDMVTKRMVKFEDVEAIFKRMTDQGGIFYEMQYVQSQTVKGQINKLRDAYDQMQNSIGKANEGVLKDMVSLLNSIVKNWRTWAVVLKSIAWGAVIGYLSKFALPLMGIGKASVSTLRSIVRLRQGVQSLGASLKANLPMLGIFAATAVISALNNLRKKMNEVNKEIDEQNLRLYETRQNFEGMKSKIEENNRILKTAGSKTEDLNKAQKENESIMQRLRNEYPQLADQMQIATNGIIDMNDALDANIRKLNEQMTVLNAMKQGNWFSDSDQKNLADWQGALATMKTTLIAAQSEARKKVMQMELGGNTDEPLYDIYKRVADIDLSGNILDAVSAFNLLNGEVLAYQSNLYKGTPTRSESLYSILGIKVGNLQANWSENRVKDVLDRLAPTLQSYYENGIKDNADFLKEINEQYGGNVTQFIQANAEKINQATLDGLNNANSILINTLKPQTAEMKTFLNQELNRLFGTTGIDYFSTSTKGTTPTTADHEGDKQSKIDAAWRRRINLIEEMKKRYDELSKSAFGYAKSEKTVREAFDDSFAEIFKGTSIDISQIDFTSMHGMMESMKVLLEKAKGVSDSVREELMKKIDSFEAQITIDAQVRIREDFGKQMEKAFNDYELTLELDKLNISPEAAKDLFPAFEVETLGELQDRMEAFYESQRGKDGKVLFDEDDFKEYKKWADKIDAEILKSRKEKAKQYSKYLEKEYSERAKLEMQHAKDVAFVTANISDEKQRDNIVANLNRKFQQDLNELNWKSFKESSFYVDMMDDLASLPKEYMQTMLNKIDEILKHPETLSPRALKEAINARQKILEAQMNLEPLDVMKSSIKTIRKAMDDVDGKTWKQTKEKINDQIKTTQEEIDKLEEEARKWDEVAAKMKVYEDAADDVETAKNKLSTATKELVDKQGIEATITQYQDEQNENQKLIEGFQKRQLEGEKLEPTEKDQLAALQTRNGILGEQIAFLNEIISRERELQNIREEQHGSDAWARREEGYASTDIGGWSQGLKDKSNKPKQRIQNLKQYLQAFKNFDDSFAKFNAAINSTLNAVQGMGNAFYDMFDALGGETDALTEGWKEFGNTMITQITQTLTMIPMMVAAFTAAGIAINSALGIIGLIAEALQLLFVAIGAIAKLHDAGYEKEIENQQKKIDNLTRAYDRLEKSIDKTIDTASYMREYNDMSQNLYEQIEALNKQIAAEEAKKNSDADKIQGYKDSIQDAEDELEELKQKQIEVFGGIGEDGYRDAAQEFVDAWKSAFLETGDGLQGLQDHFDEFLQDWFVKQATMRYASAALEPLFKMIDDAVDPNGPGGANVVMQELEAIKEWERVNFPQISDTIEEISRPFIGDGEGSLSGLAAGIQGMTEEQANILEAYWNSVRGYTASIDMNVARIVDMMVANYGEGRSVESNPMLQQLNLIAANTAATHTILQSVTKSGHTMGGSGIKVFLN